MPSDTPRPHRRARQPRVDAVLVQAVADLVQHGEHALAGSCCGEARRDADVPRGEAEAERVLGVVHPPAGLLEADRAHDLQRQLALRGDRERPRRQRRLRLGRHRLDEPGEPAAQRVEDRADLARSSSRARSGPAARRRDGRPRGSTPPGARRSSTLRSRCGRRRPKSERRLACTHTPIASDDARAISAVSSTGTRRARSWSRRATRTIAAASSDGSRPSAHGARRSSAAPSAGSTARSWRQALERRHRLAARRRRRRRGICVCWSQPSSRAAWPRSSSSARRARSSPKPSGIASQTTGCSMRPEALDLDARRRRPAPGTAAGPSPSRRRSGVPVRIRSPGSSVHVSPMKRDQLVDAEDEVARAGVLAQLAVDPGAQRAGSRGSGTSSAVVTHGPKGQKPSAAFARVHCGSRPCRSRALTSSATA